MKQVNRLLLAVAWVLVHISLLVAAAIQHSDRLATCGSRHKSAPGNKALAWTHANQRTCTAGHFFRTHSMCGEAEEAPGAYKDVDLVAQATEQAGLAHRVAFLRPKV